MQVSAQNISGRIVTDGETPLPSVLVINMSTNEKTYSDQGGNFTIAAIVNDELRFVRAGFERSSVKISSPNSSVYVNMIPAYREIEEVRVNPIKLTGDLNKDSKLLSKNDKVAQLQKEIGIPKAPEKPREKPAELGKDVLLPMLTGSLNVQAVYDLISGDARRKKHLYELEDQQSDVRWIRSRIENDYFVKAGIPEKRIAEFIEFSFTQNPNVRKYVRAKNLSGVMLEMEKALPTYILRLK